MTVSQLLNWIVLAYEKQEDSLFNEQKNRFDLCLKQSLIKTGPTDNIHGYHADEGELQLAVAIAYTLKYSEVVGMRADCYQRDQSSVERITFRDLQDFNHPPPPRPGEGFVGRFRLTTVVGGAVPPPSRNASVRPVDPEPIRDMNPTPTPVAPPVSLPPETIQQMQNRVADEIITALLANEQTHSNSDGNQCSR